MRNEETVYPNDTTEAIRRLSKNLKDWESPYCNGRIKAMILSHLEEAELLSLRLVNQE